MSQEILRNFDIFLLVFARMAGMVHVSYTHLDVYKRQR